MFNITVIAFLNTLLFSSIAILFFSCLINRSSRISGKSFVFLLFISILIMLRLLLPFEILGVQNNVNLTKVYPDIYLFLTRPFFTIKEKEWSVLLILIVISMFGSIVCAIKLLMSYYTISCTLKKYKTIDDEMIKKLVTKINGELKQNVSFRIVSSREITAPFIFGLRRHVIVLPEISLSELEWYYILSHEITHYYYNDLWIRFACELLHIIYWWNPLVYLFRRQLINFQERHIDTAIIQGAGEERKLDYLSCLIKIARLQSVRQNNWIAEFHNKKEVESRIENLLKSQEEISAEKSHRFANILIIILLVLFTLLFPNIIIFEPSRIADEILENENYFFINNDNSYLILNEEGNYEVYVDNEYKTTVTQIFDDSLPIYNKEGELMK